MTPTIVFIVLAKKIHKIINNIKFMEKYRMHKHDFTRKGKIGFAELCILILKCSKRGIHAGLIEFMKEFKKVDTYSDSAFCQARKKIKYEAFKEISMVVANGFYQEADYKTYGEYRVWAIDGSDINLPNTEEVREEFGAQTFKHGVQNQSLVSVLYDVLNHVVLHAVMARQDANERVLASEHLSYLAKLKNNNRKNQKELILMDRGYPCEELISTLQSLDLYFVIRSNKKTFWREVRDICTNDAVIQRKSKFGLITVRVLEVPLGNGKSETLITNIMDDKFTISTFSEIYHMRWGVETNYDVLKQVLQVENFSGKSPLCIRQDFYATTFLINLLACIEVDTADEVKNINISHGYTHKRKMNITRTLSVLKGSVIALLVGNSPTKKEKIFEYIQSELKKTLVPVRPGRSFPRQKAHPALKFSQNQKTI